MGIYVQAKECEVPEGDPFENDLLERKEPIEILTSLVNSIKGPCVMSLDAPWGAGKTTFINMWSKHLRNKEFPVVEFNAWKTDHSDKPLSALSSELIDGLSQQNADKWLTDKLSKTVKNILKAAPAFIRGSTAITAVTTGNPIIEKAGQIISSLFKDALTNYQNREKSIKVFRDTLQDMAKSLSDKKHHPLIIIIDELDRCRPSYAIELLENAKHLFDVDHIVFVLAVNRSELAHSVKALYGDGIDAPGYLRRFIDIDFQLPEPSRDKFIAKLINSVGNNYLQQHMETSSTHEVQILLQGFFNAPDLSLRQIEQSIHRLGLVFASLPEDALPFPLTATVALILRTINVQLYHRFRNGEVSDLDLVNAVFERRGVNLDLKRHEDSPLFKAGYLFEATIIVAKFEISGVKLRDSKNENSPLMQHYAGIGMHDDINNPTGLSGIQNSTYGKTVREHADFMLSHFSTIGFKDSVQRIELLSPDLVSKYKQS